MAVVRLTAPGRVAQTSPSAAAAPVGRNLPRQGRWPLAGTYTPERRAMLPGGPAPVPQPGQPLLADSAAGALTYLSQEEALRRWQAATVAQPVREAGQPRAWTSRPEEGRVLDVRL
jgi:hypothetical protein